MAIQQRRGAYVDFDPRKMLTGEHAIVLSGDPNKSDGKAVYMAFSPGEVKRIADEDDLAKVDSNLAKKVDKVTGKVLSTNDYTTNEKNKLAGIAEGAEVNRTYSAFTGNPTDNQTPAFGATFTIQQIKQSTTGQVSGTDRTVKIPNTEASKTAAGLMSAADKAKLDGIAEGATKITVDAELSSTSTNPVQNEAIFSELQTMKQTENELGSRVSAIEDATGIARYGVSGIGQSASALTRLYDAVGMVAQVGTDTYNANIRNDFDDAAPWKWRKCVGRWTNEDGRAVFHVAAYYGDDAYAEDGSMGDYVAVECPISYYKMEGNTLVISAHRYEEYRPFDIFCHDHNPQDTIPYYYRPAYALALKDGHAVSLPGYENEQGAYKTIMDAARTYGDGSMGTLPMTYPMALSFYDWAMFTVEFAVQNAQSIMQGCSALRSVDSDSCKFLDDTHVLVNNYYATRIVGEYIAITTATSHIAVAYKATHKILASTRADASGNASSSGTYQLLEVQDLGKGYFTYNTTTTYYIAGRPYPTGSTNGVTTPSGSIISNTNGYYPMRYRYVENLYGNQYKTTADFFNMKIGTGDNDYYLEHYYLKRPQDYTPDSTSKPDATDLATDKFVKLDVTTEHTNYVNGYIKSKKYSKDYPDIWIPYETTGGSSSTYFADNAHLVNSNVVRSVRLFGYWSNGATDGPSLFRGSTAPSAALASSGGALCFPQ